MITSNPASLPPGFRFHPTDEELILHYLRNRAASTPCPVAIIADVDIYKFDPWDLPSKAMYGDREWYFFSPRDRKYPNGIRPNRAAASGYWKATGTDKPIHNSKSNENIGVKKALVFYKGRPPKGTKTNWIMHEYRLADGQSSTSYKPMKFRNSSMRLDDWVLCRIYKKSSHLSPMVPPLADHEQDEPCSYEVHYAPSIMQLAASTFPDQQAAGSTAQRLPKMPSISDFLDDYALAQLFDGAVSPVPEVARAPEYVSLLGHPTLNQLLVNNNICTGNNLMSQLAQMDASASTALGESSAKRKSSAAGDGDHYSEESGNGLISHPAKKLNGSCFAASFSAPQVNGMQSSLGLSHHILLNSNLGMH